MKRDVPGANGFEVVLVAVLAPRSASMSIGGVGSRLSARHGSAGSLEVATATGVDAGARDTATSPASRHQKAGTANRLHRISTRLSALDATPEQRARRP